MKHVYKLLGFAAKGFEVMFLFIASLSGIAADTFQDWHQWCKQKTEDNE